MCIDGRGTGLKGRDFKKVTQKRIRKNLKLKIKIAAAKKIGRTRLY